MLTLKRLQTGKGIFRDINVGFQIHQMKTTF
jgi:hypothetical protein